MWDPKIDDRETRARAFLTQAAALGIEVSLEHNQVMVKGRLNDAMLREMIALSDEIKAQLT